MISMTGRIPIIAAPTAAPVNAISEIGVSRTRTGPNLSSSPSDVLNTPSAAATSSPNRMTRSSLSISSDKAVTIACLNLIAVIIDVFLIYAKNT